MTTPTNHNWTHENVSIVDIRKLNKLYAIKINDAVNIKGEKTETPTLFVRDTIFDERLKSYFLKDNVSRSEILGVKWNMFITQGYYIKISSNGEIEKFGQRLADREKWFVSYLEIDGPLGTFDSIHKEKEEKLF